jgi:hypothetical protein
MTVTELLKRMAGAYPSFDSKAGETWAPVFRAHMDRHEGERLEKAYVAVLGNFRPTTRQPFPIPADFEAHLPSGKLRVIPGGAGPAIDVKGHGEKSRRIMAEWRLAQGNRGANGVREIMRALEFIAEPLADLKAWTKNDDAPLRLTRKQLVLAQHRAISQQRRIEFGPPGKDPDAWWEQISAIAQRWGIETEREEWTSDPPQQQQAAE